MIYGCKQTQTNFWRKISFEVLFFPEYCFENFTQKQMGFTKNRWDLPKNNVGEFQIPFIPNADKKCYDALRRWQRKLVIREHSSLIADAD